MDGSVVRNVCIATHACMHPHTHRHTLYYTLHSKMIHDITDQLKQFKEPHQGTLRITIAIHKSVYT